MRFDNPLVEDFLQMVIPSDCRSVFTKANEKYGSLVTWAQAFSSATAHLLSLKVGCHHQPMLQSQQPEMRVEKLQRGAQK
jgi:hypothetical protein